MRTYLLSLLSVVCEMAPYLLLGFLIAGILHVFVPQGFYRKYLSKGWFPENPKRHAYYEALRQRKGL